MQRRARPTVRTSREELTFSLARWSRATKASGTDRFWAMLDGNLETAAVSRFPRFPQYLLVPSQQGLCGLAEGLLPAHLPRLHSNRLLPEHRIINHPQLEEQEPARDYLGVLLGTVCQEGPHAALQSLHVHLLGRLCVVDLNLLNLQKEQVSPQKQEAG